MKMWHRCLVVAGFLAVVGGIALSCTQSTAPSSPLGAVNNLATLPATTSSGVGPTITAVKFYDTNGNGQKDAGEPFISGWPMTVNGNPVGVSPVTVGVNAGLNTVCEATPPSGWTNTTPICQHIDVADCGSPTNPTKQLPDVSSIHLCMDANCNGIDDATEGTLHPQPCVDCAHCPDNPACNPHPATELCCNNGQCSEVALGSCHTTGGTVVTSCTECGGHPPTTELCCNNGVCSEVPVGTCHTSGGTVVTDCSLCSHTECHPDTVWFGNVCVGGHGAKSPGYWKNPGNSSITAADRAALVALCLRNSSGGNFDPASNADVASLLNQNATNMAAKLSVMLTAMTLNVRHGLIGAGDLISTANGLKSVSSLLSDANALLCADGYTPSGDEPNRTNQETIKTILDDACNDKNFVQGSPCSTPTF